MQCRAVGAPSAPLGPVERDTGLSDHQQRERESVARGWAWRIAWVMAETGCSASDALRAIEAADREATTR